MEPPETATGAPAAGGATALTECVAFAKWPSSALVAPTATRTKAITQLVPRRTRRKPRSR